MSLLTYNMWGPYPTIISKQIGETVGTVWDDHFGIGLQALNIKTPGGAPTYDNDIDPSYDIFQESGGLKDISPELKGFISRANGKACRVWQLYSGV